MGFLFFCSSDHNRSQLVRNFQTLVSMMTGAIPPSSAQTDTEQSPRNETDVSRQFSYGERQILKAHGMYKEY